MKLKTFLNLATAFFSLVALLHFVRIIYPWEVTIYDVVIPMWVSWVAVAVGVLMAWNGWRLGKK